MQARGDMWRHARQTISPSFSAMKLKTVRTPVGGGGAMTFVNLFQSQMVLLIQTSCKTLTNKFGEFAAASEAVDVCK